MDRRFAYLSLVVLIAAGCRQSPYVSSHLEILGAERRALEDRVLDLEFELERAEQKLQARGSDRDSGSEARSSQSRNSGLGASDDEPDMTSPSIVIPGLEDGLPSTLEPPRVNEGRPTDTELPVPGGDSARRSPRYQTPTRQVAARSRGPGDPRITHIELNSTLTGGTDFDRKSGDDGLVIVLEPRNADNEFVPLAGPITAVLLDYAKRDQGTGALVARWEIDAKNVHKAIVNDDNARGIQLRLPWPGEAPEHSKLRLDVRYTTADGRRLDTRADVHITLPGQFSARWTPRAPRGPNNQGGPASGGQSPVNIAQQPGDNESAQRSRSSGVIQSAFTTVSPVPASKATEAGPSVIKKTQAAMPEASESEPGPQAKERKTTMAPPRPTWQPVR